MNQGLTSFGMLVFGVSVFIFIMLLPALLELKKPKDAGPRIITDDAVLPKSLSRMVMLEAPEEKTDLNKAIMSKLADIIAVLPSLEE